MKTLLQSVIAAAGVYVLARFVTSALSPRGSSASIAEQMAAQHTTQFLNNLDEIASH